MTGREQPPGLNHWDAAGSVGLIAWVVTVELLNRPWSAPAPWQLWAITALTVACLLLGSLPRARYVFGRRSGRRQ